MQLPPKPLRHAHPAAADLLALAWRTLRAVHRRSIDRSRQAVVGAGRGPANADSLATRVQADYPRRASCIAWTWPPRAYRHGARRGDGTSSQHRLPATTGRKALRGGVTETDAESGEVNLPLVCDRPNRPRQRWILNSAKPSLSAHALMAYDTASNTSRVDLRPHTGRTISCGYITQAIGHLYFW